MGARFPRQFWSPNRMYSPNESFAQSYERIEKLASAQSKSRISITFRLRRSDICGSPFWEFERMDKCFGVFVSAVYVNVAN